MKRCQRKVSPSHSSPAIELSWTSSNHHITFPEFLLQTNESSFDAKSPLKVGQPCSSFACYTAANYGSWR